MIRTELYRVNRVSHDRHYSMVFPVEHPLFKFKSRTHTGLCLRFLLIHDSLLLFPPSPHSSYWSIQALQASLQFCAQPNSDRPIKLATTTEAGKLDSYSHSPQLVVGALAKKAWIKKKCWACNKSTKIKWKTHDKQAKKVNNHFGISLSPVRICRFVVFFIFFLLFSHTNFVFILSKKQQ